MACLPIPRSVSENQIYVHEHEFVFMNTGMDNGQRRVFMNDAPLGRSIFATDRPTRILSLLIV